MKKTNDNWDGKAYHKHSSTQHKSGLAALEGYAFMGDERVLDVGCGTGKTAAEIAAKVPRGNVIGIDVSSSMIQQAQQTYGHVKNLTFVLQDAEVFNFQEKFDLIVSFFAVHWMQNQHAVFRNMQAALKPTGRIILRMSGGDQPEINQVFSSEPWVSRIKVQTWQGKTTEQYVALLRQAGFEKIEARTEVHARVFDSEQHLLGHLMTWMPYATGLPIDQVELCARAIVDKALKVQNRDDGKIEMKSPLAMIEVSC